jgi:hypothetical protein
MARAWGRGSLHGLAGEVSMRQPVLRRVVLALGVVAASLALTGVAEAAIPGPGRPALDRRARRPTRDRSAPCRLDLGTAVQSC